MDVVLAATSVKTPEAQQIDALRREIDILSSAVNAQQEREDRRRELLGDPNSHPMWP